MKKRYIKPSVELVRFKYGEQVVASQQALTCGMKFYGNTENDSCFGVTLTN